MALTLKINGVDKSSVILWRTLNWSQGITSQVDTLSFGVQKFGSRTFRPNVLDEITLERDGERIFGGNIVSINENIEAVERQIFTVTAKDYCHLMDRRLVSEKFTDTPVINIIIAVLNRYINRGSRIEIASLEESETWSGGAIDTDNFRIGDRARKITSNGTVQTMERNIYLNLQPTGFSSSDYIDIDAFVANIENLESAVLRLGDSTLTNYFEKNITSQLTAEGWNLSHSLISSFSTTGTPSWTNIRKIQLRVKATAATTVIVTFDNWQVVKSSAFTRSGAFNATQPVNYISFNYEYPSQCFQRMAELFQWNWYVDENKDINFFDKFEKSSEFNLTDTGGDYVYNSLVINSNADQMRNSIYVRGSDYLGATIMQDLSNQADSVNKVIHLGYKYQNYSLQINSVDIPVGVDNLDAFTDNLGARQIIEGGLSALVGNVSANSNQSQQVVVGKQGRRGSISLRVKKVGAPVDNFTVRIYADDGSNAPSATPLSASSVLAGGSITTSFQEYNFALVESSVNTLFFDQNEKYHIRISRSGAVDAANYYAVEYSTSAQYEGYAYTGTAVPAWTQDQWALYFVESIDYDVLYSFQEKIITFATAPDAVDLIEWTGDPYYPVFVLYKENSSISLYGEYQFKIVDKSIKSREGARQRALQEVLAWAEQVSEATFVTYSDGLRAGQTINIQSDIRGLDENYVIQSISAYARGSGSLAYQIKCVTTKTLGILYWLQKQIMKDDRDVEISDNDLEDKIESIFENFGFSIEYNQTLLAGKVWSNDAGTTPNKLVWSGGADHIWV